jgi:hypothetical protein
MYAAVPRIVPASADGDRGGLGEVGRGRGHGIERLGEAEVEHLHPAVAVELDIGGFQVPVNDALFVRGFERFGDLLCDRNRFIDRDRALCDSLGQVVALDEFHDERRDAAALLEPVDARDVRMVQRGEDFRFTLKTCEPIGISGERGRQNLDRDLPLQLRIYGPIHLAHPAFA